MANGRVLLSAHRKMFSIFGDHTFVLRLFYSIALIIILIAAKPATAQRIKFTALTTKDGLSSNSVNYITKDKFGLIWIATLDGLNRYDGKEFKTYRLGAATKTGLGGKEINVMCEDSRGDFWVGTMGGGLYLYDRSQDVFQKFGDEKNRLCNEYINCLYCDRQGFLWVGTMRGLDLINTQSHKITHIPTGPHVAGGINSSGIIYITSDKEDRMWVATFGGLYQSDRLHKNYICFKHQANDPESLPSDLVSTLAEDSKGQLWVGTLNGLARLKPDGRHFITYHYDYKNNNSLCGNIINGIASDANAVWVATEGGLNVINVTNGTIIRYQHDSRNPYSLTSKSIQSVYIDPNGIYWIGTHESGIVKYDKNLTLFNVVKNSEFDPHGLDWPVVSSFAETRGGNIYVGCNGGGLSLFHPGNGSFDHININSREKINSGGLSILSMMMDRSGKLWIGTYQHGLFRFDPATGAYKQYTVNGQKFDVRQNNIFCLKQDTKGKIWVGTNGAGINIMDPLTEQTISMTPLPRKSSDIKLPMNGYIRDFEEDEDGCMWIASYGTGVARYHPNSGKFDRYNTRTTGLPLEHILSMMIDHDGNLWIGTGGDGLFRLNTRNNHITTFTSKNGLSNGVIHKIIEGANGTIWVSTNRGLCMLDPKSGKIAKYSAYNGLQSDSFYDGSGLKAADGSIYFGGIEGFNYFKPADIKKNNNVPVVMFNQLSINKELVSPNDSKLTEQSIQVAKEVHVAYKKSFAISYIALNYTLPLQNRYKYLLEGFNQSWIDAGENTVAYYTNLDPGTYTFKVMASNNDGVWSKQPATIKIIIPPPFWMTGYSYFFYIMVIAGGLWLFRRKGIQKVQREMQAVRDREAAEARHELDNVKIKFLTNLSHEFRTPISLIMTPADKLLSMHPDQETKSQLKVIKRNSRRLLNLVNQLLDFRKMEEHELRLNMAAGDLVQFSREIIESFKDLADVKKVILNFVSNTERVRCQFDHDKIERILFNLLSNAFKFTPAAGHVAVTFSDTFHPDSNTHEVILSVADSGIGISKTSIDKVFDRFYQADSPSSILNQGSGIGLAITKELVRLHGGDITVKSEMGQGSTFTVKITFSGAEEEIDEIDDISTDLSSQDVISSKRNGKASLNGDTANQPHVLVIEDNDELRNYLIENLKGNYKMTAAVDGRDGWVKVLSVHPDLILSDIAMPYMDGISLSKKLKNDKRTSHIPIILLTAHAREEDQLNGLASGASDYVTKPFNFDILDIKIKNLLDHNKKLKDTYQKQVKVLSPEDDTVESSSEKFIKKVAIYVEQNVHDPRFSVEDLSHHFSMSRSSFYSKVLEFTGLSPVEFIRNLKLEKAAILLKRTDLIIASIAYETGFPTPHYFSKSFKAKYGVLPSEYRQKYQQSPENLN